MRIDKLAGIYETYNKQMVSKYKAVTKTNKKDEVDLSGTAKDYQAAYKALSNVPDIRQDKVKALKEQIASGTYDVGAKEVAEKILSSFDIKG
ncbi:flagellar biosynthesis anti-sigma factor FlgM [Sporanaerobium hydrogeniformans]|uniref:flagellar biosynthesis anti-sigma factor FlgM n=1 Tax=Sporanaerobium hydrogeniformans TaxID=3072179 RepID=UPI0015D4C204|nr:flagellar biosynthesis anti-sigma factor FlgM [Sporanaerobium hydrogeniformans]